MDIYNAISFAVINHSIIPLCQPHHIIIIIYDSTQYKVGYNDGKQVSSILPESESRAHEKPRMVTGKKELQLTLSNIYSLGNT